MFPWIVEIQQEGIIVKASCVRVFHRLSLLKRLLSLEKFTQSPYGLGKNVLQTLLGASVGAFLKALITKKPLLL